MDAAAYDAYSGALIASTERNPDIIGLVFAGSTADASRRDQWSDHDFLLIVQPGQQERFRQDLSWLPDSDRIVLRFRETEHGLNVIYDYGHLTEFAVFDPNEMRVMKANAYSVPVDKADIAARMAQIAAKTAAEQTDPAEAVRHALQLIFAGMGRYARGERLSAHTFVRQWALRRVLMALPAVLRPEQAARLDNLDPFRRVEQVLPEQAAQIDALLRLDLADAADGLLDVLQAHVKPHLSDYPDRLHDVVRSRIQAARFAGR